MKVKRELIQGSSRSLPWWTWVLPLAIFFIATQISLWSKATIGTSLFYLPVPFALILTYWWGPRVLLPYYLNSVLCAGFWGLDRVELWPLYGLPEVVFVFLSWLFFIQIKKGKSWLPDITQTAYFLVIGILVPLIVYKFFLEAVFVMAGDLPAEQFWDILLTTSLGDFISIVDFSFPVLYFFTGWMATKGLLLHSDSTIRDRIQLFLRKAKSKRWKIEILPLTVLVTIMSLTLTFDDYWFLYGVLSLYVAVRFGFGTILIFNSYILLATYILPAAFDAEFSASFFLSIEKLKIQVGSTMLFVLSIIAGRVMSDMRRTEKMLSLQNEELDRFVYSVSHDLSAPLKSILGLVNIGRLVPNSDEQLSYLGKIEMSVLKLEVFIKEVLDYSQNKRLAMVFEQFKLQELCTEILDNLSYTDEFNNSKVDLNELSDHEITHDRMRVKIILNNILTNAIKYQKRIPGNQHIVKVSSFHKLNKVIIHISDNGEGIHPDVKDKIFNMFFRGTQHSYGSGLGLYIAREAAEKIGGTISVQSEYGQGTTFTVELAHVN